MTFSGLPRYSSMIFVFLVTYFLSPTSCSPNGSECLVHFKDGDFIIGGIVPIYKSVNKSCDGPIMERHGVPKVETMAYAVDMINRRSDILPNVALGYEIRNDCREEDTSLWTTLTMSDPCGDGIFHRRCPPVRSRFHTSGVQGRTVIGIIGPGSSATSLFVTRAAAIYEVPTIAYSASSDELSDLNRFPYFFRTVPPDRFQARVIIDLLLRYDWKYIALYYSTDSYGTNGAEQIRSLAYANGICIAINEPLPNSAAETEWTSIVSNLQSSPLISVAVLFSLSVPANNLIKAMDENLGRIITFIGSDDTGGSDLIDSGYGKFMQGSFFVRVNSSPDSDFRRYWNNLEDSDTKSPWYQDFATYWTNRHNASRVSSCPFPPVSEATVINGVLALAYALHTTIADTCDVTSPVCNATVNGQVLKDNILKVSYETDTSIFTFDENGDALGSYDIVNLQEQGGEYVYEKIGLWNDSDFFQFGKVQWGPFGETNDSAPVSLCIETCGPGFISVPLEKRCCYGCRRCSNNSIVINGSECQMCPFKEWPNFNFTECVLLKPVPLQWNEPALVIIILAASLGIIVTAIVTVEFIIHREKPLIKATSRELSSIILCGILLSFITPFVIVSQPSRASCNISELCTTFSFLLIFGPTALKVMRIFRIFKVGRRSASRLRFIRPPDQLRLLAVLTVIQVFISILSICLTPSAPHFIEASLLMGSLNLYCRYGYGFVASMVYNFILIVACCFFAFRTRKVPSNYNESRFIAISVYSTLIVCLSAVPVYFTATSVLYKVSTISAALILNGYLTLVLLFLPKIYAVKYVGSGINVESWRMTSTNTNGEGKRNPRNNSLSVVDGKGSGNGALSPQ